MLKADFEDYLNGNLENRAGKIVRKSNGVEIVPLNAAGVTLRATPDYYNLNADQVHTKFVSMSTSIDYGVNNKYVPAFSSPIKIKISEGTSMATNFRK